MLHFLLSRFVSEFPPLRLVGYISFRAAAAAVTALLLTFIFGPPLIARLRAMRVRQVVRAGTPDTHQSKGETPTMGGLIILACAIVPTLLWSRFDNQRYVILALLVTVWMGGIGFLDDYLKLKQKREGKKNEGLVERYKLAGQIGIGLILGMELMRDGKKRISYDRALKVGGRVDAAATRHGLILRVVGDRLVFAPPLVIEAHEIEEIGQRLQRALDDVAGHLKTEGHFV